MNTASDFSVLAFISLGANLPSRHGSPRASLEKAAGQLASFSDLPVQLSSFWQSEPLDCPPDSPVYTNAVLALLPRPNERPLTLLHRLQQIEQDFGRVRSGVLNEARVLDLDLIAFGRESVDSRELILPHPRAHERLFVLLPLQELAPAFRFPGRSESLAELVSACDDQALFRIED